MGISNVHILSLIWLQLDVSKSFYSSLPQQDVSCWKCKFQVHSIIIRIQVLENWYATGLFYRLSLSLRLLFWYVSRFPGFPSYPCFLFQNPCILRQYPVLPSVLRAVPCVVRGGGGGGPCLARRCLQPHTWCYPGVQFNLPVQFPIPGPSPAPVPAGDWGAELRRTYVNRTWQRWLRCVRLPTSVLATEVLPFSLPWLDSIKRAQIGLTSLAFCPLKEQTAKKIMLVVTVLTVLVFLDFFTPGQEWCHWIVPVRIRISITNLDSNDGVNLTIS